jgi:hypothetical protein
LFEEHPINNGMQSVQRGALKNAWFSRIHKRRRRRTMILAVQASGLVVVMLNQLELKVDGSIAAEDSVAVAQGGDVATRGGDADVAAGNSAQWINSFS